MTIRKTALLSLLATLFLCFVSVNESLGQAAKQSDDNQTLKMLLNEVTLLRKTLQRTGMNTYRSQIILERMRAHNEQVVRLTRLLEEAREMMEKTEGTIPRTIEQAKIMESMIQQETDAVKRAQLELEHKDMKSAADRYKALLERQREREQQLAVQLRAEQVKLSEMESRLDALEREIENEVERQRAEEASRDGKKQP